MSITLAVPLVHCDWKSLVLQSQHILKEKGSTEIYNIQSNCLLVSINTKYSQVSIPLMFCTCFAHVLHIFCICFTSTTPSPRGAPTTAYRHCWIRSGMLRTKFDTIGLIVNVKYSLLYLLVDLFSSTDESFLHICSCFC